MKKSMVLLEYIVQYTAESSGVVQSVVESGEWNVTGAQVSLTGLTPFTNYSIEVAAVNEQGDVGPYSDSIREQTKEDGEHIWYLSVSYFSSLSSVPGSVVITAVPSFSTISITWSPPDRPNGIIIAYEVSYVATHSSQPITRLNTTDLDTSFTAEVDAEVGTEFIFSVRAYTRVGPGKSTSVSVLTIPREMELEYLLN